MREIFARELIPAPPRWPHTGHIPLHSKGRRTREASHGEGGLQADREVTHPTETGLRIPARAEMSQVPVTLNGTPRPKTLRGAVRSRSITISDADLHRPAALGIVSLLLTPAEPERQEEAAREQVDGRRRTVRRLAALAEVVCPYPNCRHARAGRAPRSRLRKGWRAADDAEGAPRHCGALDPRLMPKACLRHDTGMTLEVEARVTGEPRAPK